MTSKYDWSGVVIPAKYIFTDQDGDVFESDFEPVVTESGWRGTGCCSWWYSECKPFDGDWQDSLEERPNASE